MSSWQPATRRLLPLLLVMSLLISSASPSATQANQAAQINRPEAPFVRGQLIVGLKSGVDVRSISPNEEMRPLAAPTALAALNIAVLQVPVGKEHQYQQQLLEDSNVLFAEPNYLVQIAASPVIPDDPLWLPGSDYPDGQYAPVRIRADYAWQTTTGSSDVIVAVIDSGIDAAHPEFIGRILPGYDFYEGDDDPQDGCGHGTHVSGSILANGNNGEGIAGMDWQAQLLPVRVLDDACVGTILNVAAGIVWATDQGARILNLSLGSYSPSTLLEDAIFYAYSRGAAIFSAAGNVGALGVLYPAAYAAYVSGVGATGTQNELYNFSSSGPAVDVVAPGVNILSTTPRGSFWFAETPNFITRKYGLMSGTSMAAAHASGAASLLLGYAPERFDTPDKLYAALRDTALDLGAPGRDDSFGAGLIQVDAALAYLPDLVPTSTPVPTVDVEYDLLSTQRCQNITYAYVPVGHDFDPYPQGNALPIFGEDGYAIVDLPFSFPFGGKSYTQVTISANGYLSFDGASSGAVYENSIIPGGGAIKNRLQHFLAPYWDDLTNNPSAPETGIYAAQLANPQRFIVEWYRVGRMQEPKSDGTTNDELTFQAVLFASGEVWYQYQSLNGAQSSGDSATIGLEYNGGTAGVQYAFNRRGAVASGETIQLIPAQAGTQRSLGCLLVVQTGAAGGTYTQPPFCINIPAGLLMQNTSLSIETFHHFTPAFPKALDLEQYAEINLRREPVAPLSPQPVVCYTYGSTDLLAAGGDPANLFLAIYDPETRLWEQLPTALDKANLRLQAPVSHFSVFGVFAQPPPRSLPVTGAPLGAVAIAILAAGLIIFICKKAVR
jgi:subtilisin family serine protease